MHSPPTRLSTPALRTRVAKSDDKSFYLLLTATDDPDLLMEHTDDADYFKITKYPKRLLLIKLEQPLFSFLLTYLPSPIISSLKIENQIFWDIFESLFSDIFKKILLCKFCSKSKRVKNGCFGSFFWSIWLLKWEFQAQETQTIPGNSIFPFSTFI